MCCKSLFNNSYIRNTERKPNSACLWPFCCCWFAHIFSAVVVVHRIMWHDRLSRCRSIYCSIVCGLLHWCAAFCLQSTWPADTLTLTHLLFFLSFWKTPVKPASARAWHTQPMYAHPDFSNYGRQVTSRFMASTCCCNWVYVLHVSSSFMSYSIAKLKSGLFQSYHIYLHMRGIYHWCFNVVFFSSSYSSLASSR